ncbi:FUSC family protein [Lactiplantibacillus daowaiensis]|uniref:FUSC family protein n=1 Tax=Lactiplantibacillus daowaiensis TaxID=2559918 RepID=A0ABW1RZY1_9LACO|nr:FUSC family protein [Lactiplantibacillus daowaiensis]
MSTYALMQLSPGVLRQKITATTGRSKWHLIGVLLLRDTALLSFAILYIASFSYLFGQASGYVGVATFCMLLSLRFVGYGYNVQASLGALFGILGLTWLDSWLLPLLPPLFALVVNFSSLLLILRLTSDTPILGNGGVYTFGYVLVTGMPVTGSAVVNRGWAYLMAFAICGWALWRHHRTKDTDIKLWWVLKIRGWHDKTFRWQFRLALGVAIALSLGQWLGNGRAMWLGFACMSILLPQTNLVRGRAMLRFSGVVVGSLLFTILLQLIPATGYFLLAPLAGFILGLTPSYFWASVLNCFGALSIARVLFGNFPAAALRIFNNGIGILIAVVLAKLLDWLWQNYQQSSNPAI